MTDPLRSSSGAAIARPPSSSSGRPASGSAGLLDTVDRWHGGLSGTLGQSARAFEAGAERQGWGSLAQLAVGAGAAVGGMVEGAWHLIRHPLQTLAGLRAMLDHTPIGPAWWMRLVRQGPAQALREDAGFWREVGAAVIDPYRRDWRAGRRWAVLGRAAVDVGTVVVGAQRVAASLGRFRATRLATRAEPVGLLSQALGPEARVSGLVLGEGQVVLGAPGQGARAARLSRAVARDRRRFRAVAEVGPRRLKADPLVQRRVRVLAHAVDTRMDDQLAVLLGVRPQGLPKDPVRAASKLARWQATDGPRIRLRDLDDLARGRIDLPDLRPERLREMLGALRNHFGDDALMVRDHIVGQPLYRGRLHVKIRDGSGLWYELQVGPRQLTQFFDTPFEAAGRTTTIHDAVYKGLLTLDDAAFRTLGGGDQVAGVHRVAEVVNRYVDEVDEVVAAAQRGAIYDFTRATPELRGAIGDLLADLPRDLWPPALR